ncbi:hypothetical protein EON65_49705 [archaeon]|nr:MAG: hypothetical protein EON65_49705 [archaeon]
MVYCGVCRGTWHVIVGSHFGCFVSNETKA